MNLTMSNFKQGRVWTTAVGGAMAVAMVFGASQAMAVTATNTENYTVSVVVDNAFTMTETTPISFGTISAYADATDTAILTLNGQTGIGCRYGSRDRRFDYRHHCWHTRRCHDY